jgi:hypothetical protein
MRLGEEDQARNKTIMLGKEDDLRFMNPTIEGYALKNKIWRKLAHFRSLYADSIAKSRDSLLLCRGYRTDSLER